MQLNRTCAPARGLVTGSTSGSAPRGITPGSTETDDPDWRALALCAETDPEAFFPEKGGSSAAARAVCQRCPVTGDCLRWALDHNIQFGVWGGLTDRARRRMRRSTSTAATSVATTPTTKGGEAA